MRAVVAIAVFVCGMAGSIAGINAAHAADLRAQRAFDFTTRQLAMGERSSQILLYDYQSGVEVRSYWRTPWRDRHYFPATGRRPRLGRHENLSAPSGESNPPQTFRRHWSTSSAFLPQTPRQPMPRVDEDQPPQNPPPLK
ncbi:MAG: hypothetical protein ABI830_09570 [Pseudolabrys sp.]